MERIDTDLILQVKELKKYFPIYKGVFRRIIGNIRAVDRVSFHLKRSKTLGIVGESGCGKTTIAKCIVRLYDLTDGQVIFRGRDGKEKDLSKLNYQEIRKTRKQIQMIFQDPYSSLNPRMTIKDLLEEPLRIHKMYNSSTEMGKRVSELLDLVGLDPSYMSRYPHELSGGQRQRVGIARALSLEPELVVCDEPVSALDVSVQAQILKLLKDLQNELGLSYIFIAHNLAVVQYMSDDIAVMYLGKIVEMGNSEELIKNPRHPYTKFLLSAVPSPDITKKRTRTPLTGEPGNPSNPPCGCRFHPRCPIKQEICMVKEPPLRDVGEGNRHVVACHLA